MVVISASVTLPQEQLNAPFQCFMGNSHGCNDIIAVWSFGQYGSCFHEDIGFRIGTHGYKQLVYEVRFQLMVFVCV